jgi:sarcosine oxidase subunit gamma
MSDAVSALAGASHQGYVTVEEIGPRGMITLRGDLSSSGMKAAATAATGVAIPARGSITWEGEGGLAWMSPDELLAITSYAGVSDRLATIEEAQRGQHFLAVDVSDARAMFRLSGKRVREVIAKLCPVDMSPAGFGPGRLRRTRMAQVAAAIWMADEETVYVICFRSVAQYVFDLLKGATEAGSEVGYPA